MKSASVAYVEILKSVVKENNRQGGTNDENFQEKIRDADLTCAVQLLEQGYDIDNIINALRKKSPMAQKLTDSREVTAYIDNILSMVNSKWVSRSKKAYEQASRSYRELAEASKKKYKDYDSSTFDLYQDGEIAMRLLRQEGYNLGTINTVLRRNTISSNTNEKYFEELKQGMADSAMRYEHIQNYTGKPEREKEIYYHEARKYMERTHTKILSGVDEQTIIKQIYNKLIKQIKKQYPQITSNQEKMDSAVNDIIKPMIKKMLLEASPVYTEPGRDKEAYLKSMLGNFEAGYENSKERDKLGLSAAKDCYKRFIQEKRDQKEKRQASTSDIIEEGQNAKNMLYNHYGDTTILQVLQEQEIFKSKSDLAQKVLDGAKKSFHAEREILNYECKNAARRKAVLSDLKMSMTELYRQMMKERVEEYPTFVLEMAEDKADLYAVEKLITRFPDYSQDKLEKAIMAASPRAQLEGVTHDYAKRIINQAKRRLRLIQERNERESIIQKKYNQLRGLSTEGVAINNNPMNRLKDGRTAVRMLRQQMNPDDVKSYLIAFAKSAMITAPLLYANEIMEKAQMVLNKGQEIQNYQTKPLEYMTCADHYMEKMQKLYHEKDFFQPQMDIRVMRDLLLEKKYPTEEIKMVIIENSPIAEEPGRDEGYADYIEQNARRSIEYEQEKFNHYIVVPRHNNGQDKYEAAEEYEYQRNRIEKMIDLPYCMEMDVMIGAALLKDGYEEMDVRKTLQDKSSLSEDESYSDKVIKEIRTIIREEEYAMTNAQDLVLVRSSTSEVEELSDN